MIVNAKPQVENERTSTVECVALDKRGKILLVHEKSKKNKLGFGKPSGWGLPGRGIESDRTFEGLVRDIVTYSYFKENKVTIDDINKVFAVKRPFNPFTGEPVDNLSFLTAIKELLEETGFLGIPALVLFTEMLPSNPKHRIIGIYMEIIAGELKKKSAETDDCRWFYPTALPKVEGNRELSLYRSHESRIATALSVLGRDSRIGYVTDVFNPASQPLSQERRIAHAG